MKRHLLHAAAVLTLAAIYFASGKVGLSLAFVNESATAVWPPSGICLAALLLLGYRVWPGVLLGAFLVNLSNTGHWAASGGIALGNTIEALAGAWLTNRFARGAGAFDRAHTIFTFIALTAVFSTGLSATWGVTTLYWTNQADWNDYGAIWLTWWVGDVVSDLIIAPLLVIWARSSLPRRQPMRLFEGALLLLLLLLVGQIVFGGWLPAHVKSYPLEILAVPPLLWLGFRFFQHGAVTGSFFMSALAVWGTLRGFGPFAAYPPNRSLLLLQTFMGTISVTALVLAAITSERKRAEERLQLQEAVSRILAESSTLPQAIPKVLQTLCDVAVWDVGTFWGLTADRNELQCLEFWNSPRATVPAFKKISQELRFPPGRGLPGRVWSGGEPIWLVNVTTEPNFPRAPAALQDKLHTGIGFPVRLGKDVLGMIECFSCKARDPDPEFIEMMNALGNQLGQFIERKQTEAALAQTEERLREQLKQHAETLEKTVAERTARLRETIGELEAFSYSISHDLRAPLRAMQNYASILQNDEAARLSAEGKGYLARIATGANRLDRLIQDVLTYSRVGRIDTPLHLVDLDKLVCDIIEQYPAFHSPRAEIQIKAPLGSVKANEAALTQCISNLLGNAVKFVTPGTAARLKIWSQPAGAEVRLCIEDNGIGIAPTHKERIFRMFERVHNDKSYEGTGIGLAIAKKAIERMEGEIGFDSEPGRGSTFWIQLPKGSDSKS
jgi:signal transduction histidine kinase/integral membrane sensor domain MASE1